MSNKNRMVPRLRFPEFRDAGAWEEKRMDEICQKISQGGTPDTSNPDYWGGYIEWLTPAEMGKLETRFIASTNRKITEAGLRKCSSDLLPINSVILSTRAPIGHLLINQSDMAINQGCKGLVPETTTDYGFLYYYLFKQKRVLTDLGSGNTFKELSTRALKNFQILIPSLPEQQKIAACLTSLDDLITAHAQKLDALKAHKKGLTQQLFPSQGESKPRLRFPEFRDAGDWVEKQLGDVGTFLKGKGISKADVEPGGSLPCIRYGELYTHYNEIIDVVKSHTNSSPESLVLSRANDVIVPASGETQIDIATASCVLRGGIALGGDLNIFRSEVNGVFLSYYLSSAKKKSIAQMAQGISVVHLYPSQLTTLKIAIPSPAEQQKIGDCLTSVDNLITAHTQKFEALKDHKKGLMQQLFSAGDEVCG